MGWSLCALDGRASTRWLALSLSPSLSLCPSLFSAASVLSTPLSPNTLYLSGGGRGALGPRPAWSPWTSTRTKTWATRTTMIAWAWTAVAVVVAAMTRMMERAAAARSAPFRHRRVGKVALGVAQRVALATLHGSLSATTTTRTSPAMVRPLRGYFPCPLLLLSLSWGAPFPSLAMSRLTRSRMSWPPSDMRPHSIMFVVNGRCEHGGGRLPQPGHPAAHHHTPGAAGARPAAHVGRLRAGAGDGMIFSPLL